MVASNTLQTPLQRGFDINRATPIQKVAAHQRSLSRHTPSCGSSPGQCSGGPVDGDLIFTSPRASGLSGRAAHRARFSLSSGCMSIGVQPLISLPFIEVAKRRGAAEHVMIVDATVNPLLRVSKAHCPTERVFEGLNLRSLGTLLSRSPSYAVCTPKGVLRGVHDMCQIGAHYLCTSLGPGINSSHRCELSSRGCAHCLL